MTLRKRHKASRYRGTRSHGRGHKNRTRGSGNRGGVGLSGTGKRGDQKKTLVIKLYGGDYFGKDKVTRKARRMAVKTIAIRAIAENIQGLVKRGLAKQTTGGYELTLAGYKVVGNDKMPFKVTVHAHAASASARSSIETAGGSVQTKENADED